jgi:prephenate dehydrogenase
MPRIAIIGLGLIGGSLGLALKRANVADLEITGYDSEPGVGGRARKAGAIDNDARNIRAACEDAALIVIATPILSVRPVLDEIAPVLGEGAVVTDTASTKREVMRWAEETLPEFVSFVGGHPMAGSERSGVDAADAALFQGRPWAVVPSVRAAEGAVQTVVGMARLAGANPSFIDAAEHDAYAAAVSHLPLVVSTALFSLASSSPSWPDIAALAGSGFRDVTRLASGSPDLALGISRTNKDNLLHWIDRFGEELRRYRNLVENGQQEEALLETFAKAQLDRDTFLLAPPRPPEPAPPSEVSSPGEQFRTFLVGEYVSRRLKQLETMTQARPAEDDELRRKLEGGD